VGKDEFAVNILHVQEINRMLTITQVPEAPRCVEGVINLRGRIIPVVDLRKRFAMEITGQVDTSRIIVVELDGKVLGFIVDCVHEVLRIDRSIVEPAPAVTSSSSDSSYIMGIGKLEDRLLILLDLTKLFQVQELNAMRSIQTNQTVGKAA
jgi:purine-binding chemotaxis protein CheW